MGLQTYEQLHTLEEHNRSVNCVGYIPDTDYIFSCSDDETIKLWSLDDTYRLIHTFEGHNNRVNTVIYIPDTKYIVSGSDDKTLIIWNYETYE